MTVGRSSGGPYPPSRHFFFRVCPFPLRVGSKSSWLPRAYHRLGLSRSPPASYPSKPGRGAGGRRGGASGWPTCADRCVSSNPFCCLSSLLYFPCSGSTEFVSSSTVHLLHISIHLYREACCLELSRLLLLAPLANAKPLTFSLSESLLAICHFSHPSFLSDRPGGTPRSCVIGKLPPQPHVTFFFFSLPLLNLNLPSPILINPQHPVPDRILQPC